MYSIYAFQLCTEWPNVPLHLSHCLHPGHVEGTGMFDQCQWITRTYTTGLIITNQLIIVDFQADILRLL